MKKGITHPGYVDEHGKLRLDLPDQFKNEVKRFTGGDVSIEVKKRRDTRSNKQNRYYWGIVLYLICEAFNEEMTFNRVVDTDFVHRIMKAKFLGSEKYLIPGGQIVEIESSSSVKDKYEFFEYIELIRNWAAEMLNLNIPEPNTDFE